MGKGYLNTNSDDYQTNMNAVLHAQQENSDTPAAFNSDLEEIQLPNTITEICSNAFDGCQSLKDISIPDSVAKVGRGAFYNCSGLSSENNSFYESENVYYLGNDVNNYIIAYKVIDSTVSSVEINSNTKFIYDSAFQRCLNLISVEIPKSVLSIGMSSFRGCESLASITFEVGSQLKTIEKFAFASFPITNTSPWTYNIPVFETITIPSSVTCIAADAFRRCVNLESVIFESSNYNDIVTVNDDVNGGSFVECWNAKFYYDGDEIPAGEGWKSYANLETL